MGAVLAGAIAGGAIPVDGAVAHGGVRTTAETFRRIFRVFLGLGTLVGVVVISYLLYNAVKYRADGDRPPEEDPDRPGVGELPSGGGGGRKLLLSFVLSAIIVISLVAWTYGTFRYLESGPTVRERAQLNAGAAAPPGQVREMAVTVTGFRFGWRFTYPNGHNETGVLRVPKGTVIRLSVTSEDVFHNFGIMEYNIKIDAIPGQTVEAWFYADEVGEYSARCFELCGAGHSYMTATVIVMPRDEFRAWYRNATGSDATGNGSARLSPVASGAAPVDPPATVGSASSIADGGATPSSLVQSRDAPAPTIRAGSTAVGTTPSVAVGTGPSAAAGTAHLQARPAREVSGT